MCFEISESLLFVSWRSERKSHSTHMLPSLYEVALLQPSVIGLKPHFHAGIVAKFRLIYLRTIDCSIRRTKLVTCLRGSQMKRRPSKSGARSLGSKYEVFGILHSGEPSPMSPGFARAKYLSAWFVSHSNIHKSTLV